MGMIPEPEPGRLATTKEWRTAIELAISGEVFQEDSEWRQMVGYYES